MVKVNRKAWLLFDIVGLALVIAGVVMYIGIIIKPGEFVSEAVFLMGMFFVIFGAVFGYVEGITMRDMVMDISRSKKVEEDATTVADDSEEPYVLDMSRSWDEPVEEETFNEVLNGEPKE